VLKTDVESAEIHWVLMLKC